MGLSELSASFRYMNFAFLKSRNYVKIQVQNEIFPRGKNPGLMHVVARGGWGNTDSVLPKNGSQSLSCTQRQHAGIQDNAADSASLMKITGWTVPSLFSL